MTSFFKKIGIAFGYAADNPNETWEEARLKFFSAIRRDDPATVERIAQKYADAMTWENGKGPSLFAALNARSTKTFEKMLDLGVDADLQSPNYTYLYTPLIHAAGDSSNKAFVDILFARGVKHIDEAIKWSHSHEMKDYLRLRKAEIEKQNASPGSTPAAAAAAPASTTQDDVDVLKPAKVQRRTPNSTQP